MGSRVFVLGPGASRWPEFGDGSSVALPLPHACFAYGKEHGLADPFAPLWRLLRRVGIDEARLLNGTPDVDALFGIVDRVRDVLWHLDPFNPSHAGTADVDDGGGGVGVSEFDEALFDYWDRCPRDDLVAFVAAVLQRSTEPLLRARCSIHQRFAAALEPGDTVVSLNADLLMDEALRATGRWFEADGYGTGAFLTSSVMSRLGWRPVKLPATAVEEIAPNHGRSGVLLLKPHGSLNWWRVFRAGWDMEIAGSRKEWPSQEHTYLLRTEAALTEPLGRSDGEGEVARARWSMMDARQRAAWLRSRSRLGEDEGPQLGPPTASAGASVEGTVLRDVWNASLRAISGATSVFVVGYSFPAAHAAFQVLLAHALTRAVKRPQVTVGHPDPDAVVACARRSGVVSVDGWRRRAVGFLAFVAEVS